VQFEREGGREGRGRESGGSGRREAEEEDFFGVGDFVEEGGGGKRKDPLGRIGGRGLMSAGTAGSKEELEMGSKRQKINFTEAGGGRRRERSP
jgi:hypothetical protein